jgi:four helix bundle protein
MVQRVEIETRTRDFALRVIRLTANLPKDRISDVIGKQLLKAGTSIGANYREAGRASSTKHFVSTLEIAQREADETLYWLDLLEGADLVAASRLTALKDECRELLAIITASIRKAKQSSS